MKENEEKDLAKDMKNEQLETEKYYENVKLELEKVILDNVTIGERHIKDEKENRAFVEFDIYIKFKGENVKIATIHENGKLIPNENLLKDEKYNNEELNTLGDMINRLGVQKDKVNLEKLKEQLKELESKTKEEFEKKEENDSVEEEKEGDIEEENKKEEQEKEDGDKDTEKQVIAKKYNVNTKDVIHLRTTGEKITENKDFSGLVKWAEGRDDVYIIANRKGEIEKVIEKKNGEYSEIETELPKIHGNNPSITIQRVGKDKITEERPLRIHQLDSKTALATVRNEWGELELLYCRKQDGEEKYWASVVPETAGKNRRQLEYDERTFLDPQYTSGKDLTQMEKELSKAQDFNNRGLPSKEEGVQVYEIEGNARQNREVAKEDIVTDLMKRDGIIDKLTVPPGYYENKAEKVLQLLETNKDMKYEQAVEQIEQKTEREKRRNNTRRK